MEKKKSEIKTRLLQFVENQAIKRETFLTRISMAASNFKGVGLNSELSADKISKIIAEYRELNPIWLLTGQGAMYTEKIEDVITRKHYDEVENWKKKYYDLLEKYNSILETQTLHSKKFELNEHENLHQSNKANK